MRQVSMLLFAAAFTYVVSLCAGKTLLGFLRVKLFRSEEYFFGFVLGSAVLSTLVFSLTAAGLAYPGVFLATGLAIVALAVWCGAHRFSVERLPPLPARWAIGFGLLYSIFAILYLRSALLPEINPDAVAYHIALPARYLREHHFPPSQRDMMANLSEGIEMLFLFAFAFGKHSAGAMVHLVYTLVLPFGMLSYGRRKGLPIVGAAGALLVFMSPIVGKLSASGYIDVAVACVVFGVFYLLEIWRDDQSPSLLVAVGLLAGFCYAAKYTAGVAVPYALGIILFHRLRRRLPLWRPVLVTALCALIVMTPYLAKNAIVIGNPFAPFANRLFPNPAMTVSLEQDYSKVMREWQGARLSQVPIQVTVRGGLLGGVVGPVFLLAPLALLALRYPVGRSLLLAAAVFLLPYFASIATRFLVPALPFVSLSLAYAVARWRTALPALVLVHAVLSWPRVVPRYCDGWRLEHVDLKSVLRIQPEDDFLRSHLNDYAMGLEIEKYVPPGEPVFSLSGFQQAYQSHEIVVGWQSAFGDRLRTAVLTPVATEFHPSWHYRYEFAPRVVRKIRLLQQGSSENMIWSVTELRVFRQDIETPRAAEWRLRVSHNPWEVQLAFDNNRVTRWTSGQTFSPGMWLELNFGKEESIDSVILECSDQPGTRMRLEFESAPGRWEALAGDPVIEHRRSPTGLRSAAAATLKLNHVYWLLLNTQDRIAEDVSAHPEAWGLRPVASDGDWRLYRFR